MRTFLLFIALGLFNSIIAQEFPFQDTKLAQQERIDDLIGRLTLEEKTALMLYNSAAIEHLGIPESIKGRVRQVICVNGHAVYLDIWHLINASCMICCSLHKPY